MHTCAVLDTGEVMCWGDNQYGRLGNGATGGSELNPVRVNNIDNAVSVSSGWKHNCSVLVDGKIMCWGDNQHGQLGNGATGGSELNPVRVNNIDNAVSVSVGDNHTCALLADDKVKCWGRNHVGQLGDDTQGSSNPNPVAVVDIDNAVFVSSGDNYACAILHGSVVNCWGSNGSGQLGNGTQQGGFQPVEVSSSLYD